MFFQDRAMNVKFNPLPAHGNTSVNMVDDYPGELKVYDLRHIIQSLVVIYKEICLVSEYEHCSTSNLHPPFVHSFHFLGH